MLFRLPLFCCGRTIDAGFGTGPFDHPSCMRSVFITGILTTTEAMLLHQPIVQGFTLYVCANDPETHGVAKRVLLFCAVADNTVILIV